MNLWRYIPFDVQNRVHIFMGGLACGIFGALALVSYICWILTH